MTRSGMTSKRTSTPHRASVALGCLLLLLWSAPVRGQDPAPEDAAAGDAAAPPPASERSAESQFRSGRTEGLGRAFPRSARVPRGASDALPAYEAALRAYEDEMNDYRRSITSIIESEYVRRRAEITANFGERIARARDVER